MKPRVVDFKAKAKRDPDFKGAEGLLDQTKKRIYVDKSVPKHSRMSRALVIGHEKAHAWMDKQEGVWCRRKEVVCDLMAYAICPKAKLQPFEKAIRLALFGGRSWPADAREVFVLAVNHANS